MQDRTYSPIASRPRAATSSSNRLRLAGTVALGMAALLSISGCQKNNPVDPADVNAAQADPGAPTNGHGQVLLSDGTYGPAPTNQPAEQATLGATPTIPPTPAQSAPPRRRESAPARESYAAQAAPQPQEQRAYQDQQPAEDDGPNAADYADYDSGSNENSPYETTNAYDNQSYQQDAYGDGYQAGYQAGIQASEPPPPLPVYGQPPCPSSGYLWNPGYWAYGPYGYYWVPGAWVAAPYTGALWTPGWWGFFAGLYRWHHGYWGPHIGFYGGVPYGFGYTGQGFHGGYWDHDQFRYNRAVTNVKIVNITNTYNTVVIQNVVNNNHVSYNGGRGGLSVRPTPSEFAAMRETHVRPLPAQLAHVEQARNNRLQYATFNQGHPPVAVATRPIAVQHLQARQL